MTIKYEGHDGLSRRPPAHTLEFLTPDFDGECRLSVEGIPVAQGPAQRCVDALRECIDPYSEPFTMTVNGRNAVVLLRTAQQRAAGASTIIQRG